MARYLDPELHELVSHLRSELSEQNSEMRALQAKNEQLQAEIDLMRKMDEPTLVALQQKNAEIERLCSEINQEVVARRDVEDKLEDACVEIERLRQELADVTSKPFAYCTKPRSEILARQQAEIERLRDSYEIAAWALADRQKELDRLRIEAAEDDAALAEAGHLADRQRAEIERLRGLLRDVDDGLDDYWITTG